MLQCLALFVLLNPSLNARYGITMSGPEEIKTTAEIVACAEKEDLQGGLRKQANVSTAEYRGRGQKVFVAWYNPYSGEAACHVYLYVLNEKKAVWERKLATVFRKTSDVSVEFGDAVTIRDVKGDVFHRYPSK
jgi:hypothetical protein